MTRDEAIERLKNMAWLYGSSEREQNIEAIDMAIEALSEPSIVRCKDCVWFYEHECRYCGRRIPTDEVGFCYLGERR